jgi:hypothetical protein
VDDNLRRWAESAADGGGAVPQLVRELLNEALRLELELETAMDVATQRQAAGMALAEASTALSESIEAAVPGIRDNHETAVMEAWIRIHEAHLAVMAACGAPDSVVKIAEDDALREMQRLLEMANTERDALQAELERGKDLVAEMLKAANDERDTWKRERNDIAARYGGRQVRMERAERERVDALQRAVNAEMDLAVARARLRATAQLLIEEVGAPGPMDAQDAARRAVDLIQRLRSRIDRAQARLDADPVGIPGYLALSADLRGEIGRVGGVPKMDTDGGGR